MDLVRTVRDVSAVARRAQLSMLAAGLAYFGFTSLLPLALLVVIAFATVADDAVATRLLEVATSVFGDELGERVAEAILAEERRISSSLVSVVVLAWSAQRLFRGADRAFAAVYGGHDEKSILESARDGLIVFLTNLLALSLLGAIVVVLGLTADVPATVTAVALFVVLLVVFLPMFYVFPIEDVTVAEVLPGTAFAAGTWAVASAALGAYAGAVGVGSYGAATLVILVLTWLYVGGLALLVGATLNAVLAGRVDPDEEWHPFE